jgi:hypothetical protein
MPMLPNPAPFPHAGAFARLRGRDRRIVRIQQRCADGTLLITAPPLPAKFGTLPDGRLIIITRDAIHRRVTAAQLAKVNPPCAQRGEVAAHRADGGVTQ